MNGWRPHGVDGTLRGIASESRDRSKNGDWRHRAGHGRMIYRRGWNTGAVHPATPGGQSAERRAVRPRDRRSRNRTIMELGRPSDSGRIEAPQPARSLLSSRHGSTNLPHHRARGSDTRPDPETGHAQPSGGRGMDAVGRPQSQLPDRSQRPEGHVAGERPAGGLEAAARRRLLVAGRSRTACSTRCTASRGEEVVLAANADTGKTLWEQSTPMTFQSDAARTWATVHIRRRSSSATALFTTGVAGRLQCLDKKIGKLLWTQQLWTDASGLALMYGYCLEPHRVSRHGHRAGRRPRQGADGVPAGRRQGRLGQERFRQRLLVADPDQRRRPGATGRRSWTAPWSA